MGTWGTAIKSNDISSDIYFDFFELYNEGKESEEISKKLIDENKELINNPNDCNNFWFTLALSNWETKKLDTDLFERVKGIIESGQDLEVWNGLDAKESEIKKRKEALDKFLVKISTEKTKPKARKKKSIKEPIFKKGTCLTFKLENGNYGGAVVIEEDKKTSYGYNLIVSTRINQPNRPNKNDFEKAEILIACFGNWNNESKVTWYLPNKFKKEYSDLFEIVDVIQVDKDYTPKGIEIKASFSGRWQNIFESVNKQFEYEKENGKTNISLLSALTKKKKWWKL